MSDKQPEALRLAGELKRAVGLEDPEDQTVMVARWFVDDAAAELRRLHAENERLQAHAWLRQKVCEDQEVRIDELKEGRDRLRGALDNLAYAVESDLAFFDEAAISDEVSKQLKSARAALAKETT